MKIDNINEVIAQAIPNSLLEVDGETPLAMKLSTWIQSAKDWIESEYLGVHHFLNAEDNARAVRIVVLKAFLDAIPSLDLVVTPTGFGVVSTDSIAPASKDRIERLVESIRSQIDAELDILLESCHRYPEWRTSERGKYFCATFLSSLRDFRNIPFPSYDDMRTQAMQIESLMAEKYLGYGLMARLRDDYNSREQFAPGYPAESVYMAVRKTICGKAAPDEFALWIYCRPVVERLNSFPELYEIWCAEMGARFNQLPFKNNIKGSYFF